MTTVRLDALPPGSAFCLGSLGLTGVVEHVSAAMVRVAIQRRLGASVERTAWSGDTEVVPIPPRERACEAPDGVTPTGTGDARGEFRHTSQRLVCGVCGAIEVRRRGRGRPAAYCSAACRTAAWRARGSEERIVAPGCGQGPVEVVIRYVEAPLPADDDGAA